MPALVQKRTNAGAAGLSAKCQKPTLAQYLILITEHKKKDHLAAVSPKSNQVFLLGGFFPLPAPQSPNLNSNPRTLEQASPWGLRHTLPPEPRGRGRGRAIICAAFFLQLVRKIKLQHSSASCASQADPMHRGRWRRVGARQGAGNMIWYELTELHD